MPQQAAEAGPGACFLGRAVYHARPRRPYVGATAIRRMHRGYLSSDVAGRVTLATWSLAVGAGDLEDGIAAFEKHDFNTAVRLIEPLAEQGNVEAEYFMGTFYMYGHGVAMDPPQATVWFKRAYGHWETQARAGNPAAMVELAGMLTTGPGRDAR